jgi:hypothetical protein
MEAAERQGSASEACVACCRWWLGFPSLNRHSRGRFRELTEPGAEYAHWHSQMLFCLTKRIRWRSEPPYSMGGVCLYWWSLLFVCFRILVVISSYKLRLRFFSACWTRMDEDYNTMALDRKYKML